MSVRPPTIVAVRSPLPNAAGLNRTAVTVTFTGTATDLPVASTTVNGVLVSGATRTLTLLAEGDTLVTYIATDVAGRSSAPQSLTVRIDRVPPVILCPSPVPSFFLNQPGAIVTASVVGGTVATIRQTVSTASVLSTQASFTAADSAGNTTTRICHYSVRYRVAGFFEPITPLALNVAIAGRNIPVKWKLTDFNNAPVTSASSFVSITRWALPWCGLLPKDPIDVYTNLATSSLQYNGGGNWQYNWKTEKSVKGCQLLLVTLADGTVLIAAFQFT